MSEAHIEDLIAELKNAGNHGDRLAGSAFHLVGILKRDNAQLLEALEAEDFYQNMEHPENGTASELWEPWHVARRKATRLREKILAKVQGKQLPNLTLPLKRKWFEQIRSGEKVEEYRLDNQHWRKRIQGKTFEKVIVTLGYPPRGDQSRRIEFPWNGFEIKMITSEEWGNEPRQVFAIKLIQGSQD